uniref:Heat shock protein 70 n=1 Tax=Acrobeloides nanus TaxID=290746 RepID=A0A914D3I4_9BILA
MVIYGTLQETNMTTDQINKVILVGGSSRIPEIKEMLEKIFTGVELNCSLNPDEAIAYGATLRANQKITNDIPNIRLNEANAKRLENTSLELKQLDSKKKGKEHQRKDEETSMKSNGIDISRSFIKKEKVKLNKI